MKVGALLAALIFIYAVPAIAGDYIIGEGDSLLVSVWGEKEISSEVKVRPDGKITIPALGEVAASGLKPGQLQGVITERLGTLIKKPVVTVIVKEITNNKVYVFGGGVKSGVYNLTRSTTLLQLLCQISELDDADLGAAYVLRKGRKLDINFEKLFTDGDVTEDAAIEPDDVIFIPQAVDRNIYVVGAVNKPASIKFRQGITVMDAIFEAGGFTRFARQNSTVIFREQGGKKAALKVKVKDIVEGGQAQKNERLRPGDYIVVKEGMF